MPTEPAPYAPTPADIARRDAAEIKRQAAYLDELRAVTQKARAEGRDHERARVERLFSKHLAPIIAHGKDGFDVTERLQLFIADVRTGREPQ